MLHLSAYARTANPAVVTVAGGLAIRALPRYSRTFFDYTCTGDVEEIRGVLAEAFGPETVAEAPVPRYDLAEWLGPWIGYAESTRNCNFRCSFCTLTADGRPWDPRGPDYLRAQIHAMGRRALLHLADNQFAGPDAASLRERLTVLREAREAGFFRHWAGFVTDAFLWDEENLRLARESGCISLLIGVESFDGAWLRKVNKPQNVRESQIALIRRCLEAGILFQYGLVFDPTERRVAEMRRELEVIAGEPEVPVPNFVFIAIPFPGTPFFREKYEQGLLLPGTRVRDLEGSTLSLRPLDGVEAVADFLRTSKNLRGMRGRHLAHQARFLWRYRRHLSATQAGVSLATLASITGPQSLSNPRYLLRRRPPRTHVSTTERLDVVYTPRTRVAGRFADWFTPTRVTDAAGRLNERLVEDLLDQRYRRHAVA